MSEPRPLPVARAVGLRGVKVDLYFDRYQADCLAEKFTKFVKEQPCPYLVVPIMFSEPVIEKALKEEYEELMRRIRWAEFKLAKVRGELEKEDVDPDHYSV